MKIPEPRDFRAALSPLTYFNWIIGLTIFQLPRSGIINVIMFLYSVCFWIFYLVNFYIGISVMVPNYFYGNSPMAIVMYQVLIYTNTCASIATPFLSILRMKRTENYVQRIQKLDDTLAGLLGFEKNYKKLVVSQIFDILIICFIILVITVADAVWLRSETPWFKNFAIMFTFHIPIMLLLVTDFTFCGATRALGRKFQDLNTSLLRIADTDAAAYPAGRLILVDQKITKSSSFNGIGNGRAIDSMHKRFLFQTIRKTHLELSKLSLLVNSIFGIQILISMAVSSVMITGLLYTIYSAFHWERTIHEIIREVMPPAFWCIIYAFKIIMISYSCASVSDEAQRSGQIIYEILGAVIDKAFQKEIQEFALQMIQNPVRFTACGFFTLDYTYVQGVIGSITTYLVILIQMSSTPSSTSTASANKTVT